MTKPTENDLFEEILSALDSEDYDPAIHLLPSVVAERWKMTEKNAMGRLRQMAQERGLVEVLVYVGSGKRRIAFKRKSPAG